MNIKTSGNNQIKQDRPILIIDGLNVFLRSFFINQEINSASQPVGGAVGFLKSLNYYVNTFCPSKIYVIWESGGPSPRRKKISPNYKANRSKIKEFKKIQAGKESTRDVLSLDNENRIYQLSLLSKILKTTPVCQIFVSETEGDDIIGYLIRHKLSNISRNTKKIIVSTDKDFYQLLEDKTVEIYDTAKKALINDIYVLKTFGISARNFCLAKAVSGDPSDNIEGVPGIGFKTLQKRFKALANEETDLDIARLLESVREAYRGFNSNAGKKTKCPKAIESILGSEELIRRNWKLIYLDSSNLSATQIAKIDYMVDNHEPKMDKLGLIKTIIESGINTAFDYDQFCSQMRNFVR